MTTKSNTLLAVIDANCGETEGIVKLINLIAHTGYPSWNARRNMLKWLCEINAITKQENTTQQFIINHVNIKDFLMRQEN